MNSMARTEGVMRKFRVTLTGKSPGIFHSELARHSQTPPTLPHMSISRSGGADESRALEVQVAEDAGQTSVRDRLPRRSVCRSRVKRWFGYTHFLLKGLEKVRTEWSLTTLVYNLKRVLNLVSFETLMAAVRVKIPQNV
jgi:hypothetical protein